jgi:hypothetical protein
LVNKNKVRTHVEFAVHLVKSNLVDIGDKDLFAGAYEVVTPVRKPVHNVKD